MTLSYSVLKVIKFGTTTCCAFYYINPDSLVYISFQKESWEDCCSYPTQITNDIDVDVLEEWLAEEMRFIEEKLGSHMPSSTHEYYQKYFYSKDNQFLVPNSVRFIKE